MFHLGFVFCIQVHIIKTVIVSPWIYKTLVSLIREVCENNSESKDLMNKYTFTVHCI